MSEQATVPQRSRRVAARAVAFFIGGSPFPGCRLFQAVFLWIVADDRGREDLRDVFHRLLGQSLDAVEVPEIALLLAPATGLAGELAQQAAHAVLALVVAGDGEHERIAAEIGEQ